MKKEIEIIKEDCEHEELPVFYCKKCKTLFTQINKDTFEEVDLE